MDKHKKSVSRICISLLIKQKYPYNMVSGNCIILRFC